MSIRFTESQLRELQQKGKIRSFDHHKQTAPSNRVKMPVIKKPSPQKNWLHLNLGYLANSKSLELLTEHRFDKNRMWRFDWCLPAVKIAIEYEGIFSNKSRHTTISGFTGDIDKYNAATQAGWKVIRLTAKDFKNIIQILNGMV